MYIFCLYCQAYHMNSILSFCEMCFHLPLNAPFFFYIFIKCLFLSISKCLIYSSNIVNCTRSTLRIMSNYIYIQENNHIGIAVKQRMIYFQILSKMINLSLFSIFFSFTKIQPLKLLDMNWSPFLLLYGQDRFGIPIGLSIF